MNVTIIYFLLLENVEEIIFYIKFFIFFLNIYLFLQIIFFYTTHIIEGWAEFLFL